MREILQFNKKYMEHRYVEVIPSSVDEKRRFATRLISANGAEPDLGNVAPYEFTVNNGVMVRAECLVGGREREWKWHDHGGIVHGGYD